MSLSAVHRIASDPVRLLLGDFAAAWARQALDAGAAPADESGAALLVTEPFAGRDHPRHPPLAERWATELSRLGERRPPGWAIASLAEEDPVKAAWLRERLAGAGPALTVEVAETVPTPELALRLPSAAATLALVDAGAAAGLALDYLRTILDRDGAALLLRVPAADLRRLEPYRGTPVADLPPYPRRIVAGISALLDDPRHGWLREPGGAAGTADALATRLRRLGHFASVTPTVPAGGAEPEYLLLATATPSLQLALHQAIHRARETGALAWPAPDDDDLVRYPRRAALELFGGTGEVRRDRVVDTLALAARIATRFHGRTATLAEVIASVASAPLFFADVRRALADLRRDGRALFRSLATEGAEIAFPRGRATRPARSRRRDRDDLVLDFDGFTE